MFHYVFLYFQNNIIFYKDNDVINQFKLYHIYLFHYFLKNQMQASHLKSCYIII